MSIPVHTLNIFQKPAIGNGFINRLPVYNYKHTIAAVGGFDTASCDIAIRSRDEGQQFLDQYIGNRVAFYVDNPVAPIWEGFINRMSFNAGGVQYSISLDKMANRLRCIHIDPAVAATNPQATTIVNSTDSQALYGIKMESIDLGVQTNGTTSQAAIRDTQLAQRAYPKTSITQGQGGGLLHIEFLGFYHTLEWETYIDTSIVNAQLGVYVDTLIAAVANGTTFFDNTDTTLTVANTLTIRPQSIRGDTFWDRLMMVQEVGDNTNYYVVGLTPTDFQTGTRRLYYRIQNVNTVYTARQADGLRMRNLYGQLVPPWTVQPDAVVRVPDMLIGWNGIGDNPAETYITAIDYDANAQRVTWRGDDDTTAEGAMQFRKYSRSHTSKRFGEPRRPY